MSVTNTVISRLYPELGELEETFSLRREGKVMRTTDCYYLGIDLLHVLFNTSCPDELRKKVNAIIAKYLRHQNRVRGKA